MPPRRGRPRRVPMTDEETPAGAFPPHGAQPQDQSVPASSVHEPPVAPTPGNAVFSELAAALHSLVGSSVAETVTQAMVPVVAQLAQVVLGQQGGSAEGRVIRDFNRWNPPVFIGETAKPEVAELWLSNMEDLFHNMNCPEEHKVRCVVHVLKERAHWWWKSAERSIPTGGVLVTWTQFKEEFLKKFLTPMAIQKMIAEFTSLRQGGMTVAVYEEKFSNLCRYAPRLVEIDKDKMDMFVRGLRLEIQAGVNAHDPQNFATAVQKALYVELQLSGALTTQGGSSAASSQRQRYEPYHRASQPRGQFSQGNSGQGNTGKFRGQASAGGGSRQHGGLRAHQERPQKAPQGSSQPRAKRCYRCGQEGHFAAQCSLPCPSGVSAPAPPVPMQHQQQGRVFATTRQQAEEADTTVTGMGVHRGG